MGKERSKEWYDAIYQDNTQKSGTYSQEPEKSQYYQVWQKTIDIIKEKNLSAVLDIGCGPGQFGKLCIKNKLGYLGWDFSKTAIEMAKRLNPNNTLQFKVCSDLLTMRDITFPQVITMIEVLEHIDKDILLLNKLFCKTLIISVPDYNNAGHVRWFRSEEEIRARYGEVIPIEKIIPIRSKLHTIFIIVATYET
jgi:SAM-dependent methyltransferase